MPIPPHLVPLPADWVLPSNLTVLRLSSNKLTGGLPTKLWLPMYLKELYIDSNAFVSGVVGPYPSAASGASRPTGVLWVLGLRACPDCPGERGAGTSFPAPGGPLGRALLSLGSKAEPGLSVLEPHESGVLVQGGSLSADWVNASTAPSLASFIAYGTSLVGTLPEGWQLPPALAYLALRQVPRCKRAELLGWTCGARWLCL